MKRLAFLCALCFLLAAVVSPFTVLAAGFQITGPELLRPGDSITVEVAFTDCADIYAFQGELVYNAEQFTLQEAIADERENWSVDTEQSEGKLAFVGYDMQLSSPLEGYVKVLSCTFVVTDTLQVGEELRIEAQNVLVSDGNSDMETGLIPYQAKVATAQQIAQSNVQNSGVADSNLSLYLFLGAAVVVLAVFVVAVRRLHRRKRLR